MILELAPRQEAARQKREAELMAAGHLKVETPAQRARREAREREAQVLKRVVAVDTARALLGGKGE